MMQQWFAEPRQPSLQRGGQLPGRSERREMSPERTGPVGGGGEEPSSNVRVATIHAVSSRDRLTDLAGGLYELLVLSTT